MKISKVCERSFFMKSKGRKLLALLLMVSLIVTYTFGANLSVLLKRDKATQMQKLAQRRVLIRHRLRIRHRRLTRQNRQHLHRQSRRLRIRQILVQIRITETRIRRVAAVQYHRKTLMRLQQRKPLQKRKLKTTDQSFLKTQA